MRQLKFITTTLFIVALLSCTIEEATDQKKCLSNVRSVFPNSKIYVDPTRSKLVFYVVDSTGLRKVTTLNSTNANIDGITELILVE